MIGMVAGWVKLPLGFNTDAKFSDGSFNQTCLKLKNELALIDQLKPSESFRWSSRALRQFI